MKAKEFDHQRVSGCSAGQFWLHFSKVEGSRNEVLSFFLRPAIILNNSCLSIKHKSDTSVNFAKFLSLTL